MPVPINTFTRPISASDLIVQDAEGNVLGIKAANDRPLRDSLTPAQVAAAQGLVAGSRDQVNTLFFPAGNAVLSKHGKTAFDITLANVTAATATNMARTLTTERSRFGNETVKVVPSADTGCIFTHTAMAMISDPVDQVFSIDVYIEQLPPDFPPGGNVPVITVTLCSSSSDLTNSDAWAFNNAHLRQGWNTLKMWSGDDTTGGYRASDNQLGMTRTRSGTGYDFTTPANYLGIRFSFMNGYTVHVDQVRRAAKARTKIVIGMDATGTGVSDNVFLTHLAPLFAEYKVPSYFTYTWVYNDIFANGTAWNREVTLFRDWGWDAINHTWNHGGTMEGRRNTVTLNRDGANLVTVTYAAAHAITIGRRFKARISNASPSDMNGYFWMTPTTTLALTYTAAGSEGAGTGTISIATTLSEVWPTANAEDQRLLTHEIADTTALMKGAGYSRGAHLLAWPNNSVPELGMTQISCAAAGVAFGRGVRAGNVNVNEFGVDNPLHFGSWPFESTASTFTTVPMLQLKVLGAIGRGDCVFLFGHFILDENAPANIAHVNADLDFPPGQGGNPAPPAAGLTNADGGWWYLGQMRRLLAWLQPYRDSGQVEVLSYGDFAKLNGYGVGK